MVPKASMRLMVLLVVMGLLAAGGCARSPEAKKARHLARGDQYFGKAQYSEAILEYQRALRIDPKDARVIKQLAVSFYRLDAPGQAFPYLVKALELDPGDADIRLKLGTIYLQARQLEKAWEQATLVLESDPKNLEGIVLLARAAGTPERVELAIPRIEGLRTDLGQAAKLHLARGTLYLRKRDFPAAEQAFQEAVAREPKSIEMHTGLAEFYERRGDNAQAEREYRAAAELARVDSQPQLKLAEFLAPRKPDDAKRLLGELTQKA